MENQIAQARRLVCEEAPEIIEAVAIIVAESETFEERMSIEFMIDRFDENPMLLYASILYVTSEGVKITFLPRERTA